MEKMKFFAMAFAAIVAVAFNACKPQNEPKPDDGGDGDKTPTQVEVALEGILVDTYYGEAFPMVEGTESYTILLTNEKENATYSVSLASYPNELAAPVAGKYTVAKQISAAEEATVTKVIGEGEGAVEVATESGDIVIAGDAKEMEITLNIKLADGESEKLHYKGAAQVLEYKMEMYTEFEKLSITSMTLDNENYAKNNFYAFTASSSEYSAQGLLSAVVKSPQFTNGIMQIMLSYLFLGEQKDSQTLPTGEFQFYNMYKDGEAEKDMVTASDYYIYYLNGYASVTGKYYFNSEIRTITADGVTNIFYPQTGTLKIEAGSAEGSMKFTLDATSFNGSTFKGTFELPEYVEEPSSAPQRLAPKAEKQWGRMLPVREFPVTYTRVK